MTLGTSSPTSQAPTLHWDFQAERKAIGTLRYQPEDTMLQHLVQANSSLNESDRLFDQCKSGLENRRRKGLLFEHDSPGPGSLLRGRRHSFVRHDTESHDLYHVSSWSVATTLRVKQPNEKRMTETVKRAEDAPADFASADINTACAWSTDSRRSHEYCMSHQIVSSCDAHTFDHGER